MLKLYVLLAAFFASFTLQAAEAPRYGLPWDWSHRAHVQHPELPQEAMDKGEYDAWLRKVADPRYLAALVRRVDKMAAQEAEIASGAIEKARGGRRTRPHRVTDQLNRDWSNVMGGAAGVGVSGAFPAKYAFDINAAADCVNDFVVYGTGSAGVTGSGNFASRTGTFTGNPGAGTVTITNGTRVLTLTRSTTQNDGLFFQTAGSNAARAVNLAAAINRNGGTVGVRASSAAAVVTVTSLTQGTASNSITLADGVSGFAWAGGTLQGGSGTAGQPTIIAFNQLYETTCDEATNPPDRPLPNTFWAYNTGNLVETSPVISLDGSQVAFIERNGTASNLVILKWSSTVSVGTVGAPTAPTLAGSAAAYRSCTAPCMFKLALAAANTKTITGFDGITTSRWGSSPYYDYDTDSLYVGTSSGVLHKFDGVFIGNPAAAASPWPVTVATGLQLSSPVYVSSSGLVYVGSERSAGVVGAGTGGRLHSVSAAGAVVSSGELAKGPYDDTGGTGVADAPLIDSSAQRAYVFVMSSTAETCSGAECSAVIQVPINASINGVTGVRSTIGRGELKERILWMGTFSDAYWASTPASPTGHVFVCASDGALTSSRRPTLWRIPITANVMGAAVVGPTLVNADAEECSPITEVFDGATDRLFVSVPAGGNAAGCAGACIYMYNATGTWNGAKAASAGLAAPGGTGGIIIDNISTSTGASQVYYSTRTSPGNAIQASQPALN